MLSGQSRDQESPTSHPAPPAFHLRPGRGWLNDPNGMVHRDGRWHVFYQHNPHTPTHTDIHWGHASSADLLAWRHHPVAFGPTAGGPDSHGAWSGVFVSGLERPAVAYSGVVDAGAHSTVVLRWGSDDLDAWSEPIVVGHTPSGAGVDVMRDPFLFTWNGRRWALLGAGLTDGTPAVLVFDCEDILAWRYAGVFLDASTDLLRSPAADIWECPQLDLRADGSAAMLLSLQYQRVLGAVLGTAGRVVDAGGHPRFVPTAANVVDLGDSYYAPQLAQDPSGAAPLVMGWVREPSRVGETEGVAGCMSLPRRLVVRDDRVLLLPDPALAGLPLGPNRTLAAGEHALPPGVRIDVPAGTSGVLLASADPGAAGVELPAGETWVDSDVVESYPLDGPPSTWRLWPAPLRLIVAEGGSAAVAEVTARTV